MLENIWYKIYLFIYPFINFAKRPGTLSEQATLRGPEKNKNNNMDKTNTNNDDSVLVETIETEITNRIGANINKRINNTFDGASWSMTE